jgi:hypothetical protein
MAQPLIAFFLFRHSSGVIWRRFNSARKKRKNQFYDTLKDMKKIELLVPVQKEKRESPSFPHSLRIISPLVVSARVPPSVICCPAYSDVHVVWLFWLLFFFSFASGLQ